MKNKFLMYSRLQTSIFDGYKSVLIGGANFKNSPMYLSWNRKLATFKERSMLKNMLQFQEYNNCDNVEIFYMTKHMERWSKYQRDKPGVLDHLVAKSLEIVGDEPFAFSMNKDADNTEFLSRDGIELPQAPHGLNCFGHLHNVIILSARNPSPPHILYLDAMNGVHSEAISVAIHQEAMLQIAMRIIRKIDDKTRKRIIVPDLATAKFIQSILKGSKLIPHLIDETEVAPKRRGRKPSDKTPTELKRESRQRIKDRLLLAVEQLSNEVGAANSDTSVLCSQISCQDNTYHNSNKRTSETQYYISLWADVKKRRPYFIQHVNIDVLEHYLEGLCSKKFDKKEENELIISTQFDGDKFKKNARAVDILWLDVDEGDMTLKDFASIFPSVRFIAYTTRSSTKKKPRYRIVIPLSRSVLFEVAENIWKQIAHEVELSGFPHAKRKEGRAGKVHGIDPTVGPWLPVYLPCEPEDPEAAMFKVFKGGIRRIVDPVEWLKNSILPVAPDAPPLVPGPMEGVDEIARQRAHEAFKQAEKGQGNEAFKVLAIGLWVAGVTSARELQHELECAAECARSKGDRRRNAKRMAEWVIGHFSRR